jgi:hypothetical protein
MNETLNGHSPTPTDSSIPGTGSRALWDKVLTTTPVVLTVLATLLAGQSSSEMTRAQYHRSLASQNQSKAGDQWSFFQAMRTRKIILEKTGDLLDAMTVPDRVEAEPLQTFAGRLAADFEHAREDSRQLLDGLTKSASKLGKDASSLQAAGSRVLQTTEANARDAGQLQKRIDVALQKEEKEKDGSVFFWLNSDRLPEVKESRKDDPLVTRARQAISDRKSQGEIEAAVLGVDPKVLQEAIDAAEANAAAFDEAAKPIDKRLRDLDQLVSDQVRLTRRFYQSVRDLKLTLAGLSVAESQVPAEVRSGVERLDRQAGTLKSIMDEWNLAFKAAWNRYNGRRYDGAARYNQEAAFLYEIQVHQNSAHSDRHLTRSRNFFYGLLGVQLAVTIATLALAVRQKSLLWGLASVAGVSAVIYSVYVYLDLIP